MRGGTLMQLREIMSHPVFTIRSNETANDGWDRMREQRVRHLVVMQDSKVVGVISRHDLSGPHGGGRRRMGRSVGELMSTAVVMATPATTVKRAALLMRDRAIGCVPIVQRGRVIGIVTISDLLARVA